MNLHIVPDNTFVNKFYDNLEASGLLQKNRMVVRTNHKSLSAVKRNLLFGPLYSSQFTSIVGPTIQYEKVFIHYFTPLLYRWVARNEFQELNWIIWGGDLYNLPSLDHICYEPLTGKEYNKKDLSVKKLLYTLKVWAGHAPFKNKAYAKVKNILTWMLQEYQFALKHLPVQADHRFFFYENQMPYGELDALRRKTKKGENITLVIGNSGSPTNNHLDLVQFLEDNRVKADLLIPVSYGDTRYISFLKRKLKYSYGKLEFIDRYMPFEEYLQFLSDADGLVMNTIRPQGYGNIFMMLYMDKPVFFNDKNISLPDLTRHGLKWKSLQELVSFRAGEKAESNKAAVIDLLSHDRLLKEYMQLFG